MIANIAETKPHIHTNGHHERKHSIIPPEATAAFLAAHPGFVPSEFPPQHYDLAVSNFIDPGKATEETDAMIDVNVKSGERASYNGHWSPYEAQLAKMTTHAGVYNVPEYQGNPYTMVIQSDAAEVAHVAAIEALREQPIEVVAPFAQEPETIEGVINYAASRVGMDRVHAINAGVDRTSAELAASTGAEITHQPDILRHIDIKKLQEYGVIPADLDKLKGSKGLTMYTALLKLEAMGRLSGRYIAFHDTDIVNAGPKDGSRGTEEDYAALDYLALPLAYPVGPVNAVHIAKTGNGRNNESWTGEVGHMMNDENPQIQHLAHYIAPLVWPLTGERMIKVDVLRKIPFPTDMNVETMLDFAVCGIDAQEGQRKLMQVANATPKRENRESTNPREWGMIYACEAGLKTYFNTVRQTGKYPHEWDHEIIGIYNMMYGNKPYRAATKDEHIHRPQQIVKSTRGILMPTIDQLYELDAVDWDGIRQEIGVK
ncbi:hypothetical protein BH09PAT2_BH09PAT2_11370 [soil metagenome]